jgi:hypothetical protein
MTHVLHPVLDIADHQYACAAGATAATPLYLCRPLPPALTSHINSPPLPPLTLPQEEAEADYQARYPDHFAAFSDIAPAEEEDRDLGAPPEPAQGQQGAAQQAAEADEEAARLAAARRLLEGPLLAELVEVHDAATRVGDGAAGLQ